MVSSALYFHPENITFLVITISIYIYIYITSEELKTLKDGTRRREFETERPKVEKLVEENRLETYVIVTNYQLPASQAKQLDDFFREAGAKNVEVFGFETMCNLLNDSPDLKNKILDLYPDINPASTCNPIIYKPQSVTNVTSNKDESPSPSTLPKLVIKGTVLHLQIFF